MALKPELLLYQLHLQERLMLLHSSGADISAISKDMAEILGLDLSGEKSPAYGIGGKTDAVDTSMNVIVNKGHERYTFRIPVKVVLGDYDFPPLLGRAGFFEKFVISFKQREGKILLKRYNKRR